MNGVLVEAASATGRTGSGSGGLRIAVVGAGVSGLVAAKVLTAAGHEVVVFEAREDVGGVWSASRAYPGVSTQDDRASYSLSDAPIPEGAGAHAQGHEVQAWLQDYAARHGLEDRIRLSHRVHLARPDADGWTVTTTGPAGAHSEHFDWLVAANGVFSTPHVPAWPGRDEFEAAGGVVIEPGSLGAGEALDGARTIVVGWGKTACDLAVVAAKRSASVDVIARTLTWKYPKKVGLGPLTFKHLVLTRAGERIIAAPYRSATGRLLWRRLPERVPRQLLGRAVASAITRTSGLAPLGLVPRLDLSASTSLVSEGFFERVQEGSVRVHRERSVAELGADSDGPFVRLTDGQRVGADVIVAATGYEQRLPFLPEELLRAAVDANGALLLHRRVLALDVPRLAFIGWAHSYRSPLTSEVAAVWLAGWLAGGLAGADSSAARRAAARFRVLDSDEGTRVGTLPGVTAADLDRMLADLGRPLPLTARLAQWIRPLDPADYAAVLAAATTSACAHRVD